MCAGVDFIPIVAEALGGLAEDSLHHPLSREGHCSEGQPPRLHHLHQASLPPSRHRPVAGERLPLAAPPANPLPRSGRFSLSTLYSSLNLLYIYLIIT